jgi:hypothetical protein
MKLTKVKVEVTDEQKEEIRAWTNELRTTTKGQTQNRLKNGDTFCCLGIYLESKDPNRWERSYPFIKNDNSFSWRENGSDYNTSLPLHLSKGLGLDHFVMESSDGNRTTLQSIAIGLNDRAKYSFSQIADVIDKIIETGYIRDETIKALKEGAK